jgi:hypothetical protein
VRREQGQTIEAARVASFLAWDYGAMRGANAVANGWLQRARRLVEGREPSAEQAWLPLSEASFHLDTDPDTYLNTLQFDYDKFVNEFDQVTAHVREQMTAGATA